jgi:hypothetical protein
LNCTHTHTPHTEGEEDSQPPHRPCSPASGLTGPAGILVRGCVDVCAHTREAREPSQCVQQLRPPTACPALVLVLPLSFGQLAKNLPPTVQQTRSRKTKKTCFTRSHAKHSMTTLPPPRLFPALYVTLCTSLSVCRPLYVTLCTSLSGRHSQHVTLRISLSARQFCTSLSVRHPLHVTLYIRTRTRSMMIILLLFLLGTWYLVVVYRGNGGIHRGIYQLQGDVLQKQNLALP